MSEQIIKNRNRAIPERPYVQCCKNFFRVKNLFRMFVINVLITILLSAIFIVNSTENWLLKIGINSIYTFSIGTSIFTIIGLFQYFTDQYPKKIEVLLYTLQFILGGVTGTFIGNTLNRWILDFSIEPKNLKYAFLFNLVLSILFGTAATVYFTMRDRLEQTITALKEKEIQEQKLNQLKTQAQLEALQSKINPHFLFNTLNSISSLISDDPKVAEGMIEKLSSLFRYALQASQKKWVTLTEELEIVRSYLEIEKIRLGERLQFRIHVEKSAGEVLLPGMMLQPIVENSIKHGISPKVEGGKIDIIAKIEDGKCKIVIKDNGVGLISKESENGHGLQSVQERLRLTYGDQFDFKLTENSGVEIEISIPLEKK